MKVYSIFDRLNHTLTRIVRLSHIEIALIQVIFYSIIFLLDTYIGFMLALIAIVISGAILIISLITELVERSKVPKSYFVFMGISILCPLIVMGLFVAFYPDALGWMDQ